MRGGVWTLLPTTVFLVYLINSIIIFIEWFRVGAYLERAKTSKEKESQKSAILRKQTFWMAQLITNSVLAEIWSKYKQLCCSFIRMTTLNVRLFFTTHISFVFWLKHLLLYHLTKFCVALTKRIVDYFYHKCTVESWLIGKFLKMNNFDWGNSISNHPEKIENVTHTSQIFFKLSQVLDIIKTRQSWKFELVTPSGFQNIVFLRFHVCCERPRNRDIRKWRFLCIKWLLD